MSKNAAGVSLKINLNLTEPIFDKVVRNEKFKGEEQLILKNVSVIA